MTTKHNTPPTLTTYQASYLYSLGYTLESALVAADETVDRAYVGSDHTDHYACLTISAGQAVLFIRWGCPLDGIAQVICLDYGSDIDASYRALLNSHESYDERRPHAVYYTVPAPAWLGGGYMVERSE